MGECIFENAGNFMLDSYQTKNKLPIPRTFGKTTYMNQELFGTQSNNYLVDAELDYFDQILKEHCDKPTRTLNENNSALDENLSGLKVNKKPQLNLRQVSCQLLQKLQEKRVNLVLVATSLEENDVVQRLKDSLDPETSSMIPLSFDENNNAIDQVPSGLELASLERESNTDVRKNPEGPNQSKNQLCSKGTTAQQKDKKYWKRRTSNNEAARRSREAKRARFIWVQNRTKELEVENSSLQKELKNLEQKVLELERKAGK